MSDLHPADEILAVLAAGEADAEAERHVAACPACAARLEAWRKRSARMADLFGDFGAPPAIEWPAAPARILRLPRRILAAAAALLLAAGAALWLGRGAHRPVRLETPGIAARDVLPGERIDTGERAERFAAAGGARLWAAPGTALVWKSPDCVLIERGRLHVARAKGFRVETPRGTVTDLGTSFVVEAGAKGASVAVLEGRVRLEGPGLPALELSAGRSAPLAPGAKSESLAPAALDAVSAWAVEAAFDRPFDGVPLGQVLDQLGEISGLDIRAPESVRAARVKGYLRPLSADGILRAAALLAGADIRRDGRRVVLAVPGK